ncbi:D-alanyl-D-alanine carboxypeptidase family protein [Halanaerobaculum tunisiense]
MKKSWVIILVVLIMLLAISQPSLARPQVSAKSAIVIDVETGKILYRKNIHQRRPPASTTKIMTGILAIEEGDLNDQVTASKQAAYQGGSSIYLTPQEKLSLREMVYGLLVKSGNDAAVAIAEHIGGSVEEFARMMNWKAREIGALQTTFQNPNGLPNDNHLTTAYDLAQIARYALHNDFFAQVVSTSKKRVSWPQHSWDRILKNTNKLLTRSEMVDGVKTGYTKAAGRCLVASATQDGRQLISVVLKSNQMWQESLDLLNYGFKDYQRVRVIKAGDVIKQVELKNDNQLRLTAAKDFTLAVSKYQETRIKKVIKINDQLQLPIAAGDKLGTVGIYDQEEKLLGRVELVANRDIPASGLQHLFNQAASRIQTHF